MPQLLNRKLKSGGFTTNLRQSYGPFVALDSEYVLFDAEPRQLPLWFGYNASALFGMLQFRETWTGQWTEQLQLIRKAYQRLVQRMKSGSGPPAATGTDPLTPAALLYSYISMSVLEQYADEHRMAAETIENEFGQLMQRNAEVAGFPFVNAREFEFGFELKNNDLANRFSEATFRAGIRCRRLSGPWRTKWRGRWNDGECFEAESGFQSNKFLFRLNMAYRPRQMQLFWQQMRRLFEGFQSEDWAHEPVETGSRPDIESTYQYHSTLIEAKSTWRSSGSTSAFDYLASQLSRFGERLRPVVVTAANYPEYRAAILRMQDEVYEPVRRSPPEEFDMLFESGTALSIVVVDESRNSSQLIAISFAGRLGLFTQERGVGKDPFLNDENTYYSMDLTIADGYRGGLGRVMKQAMVLLAMENGVTGMHGRNRDRLARGMWAINLSLGSFELKRLVDDYPDEEPFRDCIYYRCPFEWSEELNEDERRQVLASIPGMVNGYLLNNRIVSSHDDA